MSEDRKLIAEAREKARSIEVFVDKYSVDPPNYFTSYEALELRQKEADLWTGLADALEAALEREPKYSRENHALRRKVGSLERKAERLQKLINDIEGLENS